MRDLSLTYDRIASPRIDRERWPAIWLTLVAIAALLPAFIFGVPSNLDLSNHFRFAVPFYEAIQQGHLYPGWLAESNAGYGDASFRFYPPGVYYLLAVARFISGNWYSATLSIITVISVLSALGTYFWARQFLTKQVAIWAGVFYVLAPYHVNQLYQAFMLAEFAGAAVLPFVLGFTERLCRRAPIDLKTRSLPLPVLTVPLRLIRSGATADVAGLAASIAILVLTHLPLAVICLLVLPIYARLSMEGEQRRTTLGRLVLGVGLGLAASACYWLTMVAELSWIRADNVKPDPSVDFRRNFVFSTFSPDNLNVWWMNILVFASIAMFWPCVMLFRRSWQDGMKTGAARAAGILAVFALFLATPLSRPVWSIFTPLQYVQFPWRWLIVSSVAASIALASAIPFWIPMLRDKRRPLLLLALGTVIISVAFSGLHTVRDAQFLDAAKFEATLREIPGSTGVSQWWPVWVKEPWKEMNTVVDAGSRSVSVKSWEPEKRSFQIAAGPASEVRVRTFFYPHWIATTGTQSLKVRPDEDGALLISVPNTETVVNLEFREPQRVYWTAVVSALGWLTIGLLAGAVLRGHLFSRSITG